MNGVITDYGHDAATNELTTLNGAPNYTHDPNGNLKTSANYEFIYNAENQLIQVKRSGIVDATYEYNWQGLRSKKIAGSKVEYYYYTGDELTYITDGSNALKYFFVRDTNGSLLHMIDYKANPVKVYTYVHDVHGSIVGLANETGSIVLNYQYDAWGVLANTPESIVTGSGEQLKDANPFRYSGYQFDSETGLYYLKARYYSPGLGRFLTMDPMIRINRYWYANNNPVNLIDTDGYSPKDVIKRIGKAIRYIAESFIDGVLGTINDIVGYFNTFKKIGQMGKEGNKDVINHITHIPLNGIKLFE